MPDYPSDEFDDLAAQRGPVGVHRAKSNPWSKVLVGVLCLILGGALAYGAAVYLWRQSGGEGLPPAGPQVTPQVTQTHIIAPSATVDPSSSVEPSPEPTETAPPLDLATPVAVLNGAGISGLAARQQEALVSAGFTTVTATNLTSAKPAANTVRYASEDQATTAARVAEVLGIAAVELGTTTGGGIDVLLVTDPAA